MAVLANRIARLQRVVDSTGLQLSPAQKLLFDFRMELIAAVVLGTEYPITPESSPVMARQVEQLRLQLERQPPSPPYGAGVPTIDILKLIERFETDLARVPAAQKRFEHIYSQVDPADLGLPVERFRDPAIEARIARTLRELPRDPDHPRAVRPLRTRRGVENGLCRCDSGAARPGVEESRAEDRGGVAFEDGDRRAAGL